MAARYLHMHSFDTISQVIDALRNEGYTQDFNLSENCFVCERGRYNLTDNAFMVDKFYRFEGNTDPADEAIVYAISSDKLAIKGVLVNAFGIYNDTTISEMIKDLRFRNCQ